jgi:hypothetical protein
LSHLFPNLLHSRQHGTVELRGDRYVQHETGSDTKINPGNSINHTEQFDVEATWVTGDAAQSSSPKNHKYSWNMSGPQD